ncbi:polysaccharide biosynthesis C-terminal domain-containing protein [Stutzerimonas sp. VN223-3]|uniref:lipopolysaccharide biosynthesis protein n=1 Tax=Stutzerimonas sp. VN223-3 TaxID=3384601 RepID=UPI0038B4E023
MKSVHATDAPEPGMKAELVRYARLVITKGSGSGAMLGLNILLARLLVPDLAGTIFFCVALGTFVSLVSRLGLDVACLKNIASLQEDRQRSYFDRSLTLAFLANVPAILIGLVVVYFSKTTESHFQLSAILFASAALCISLTHISSETLKAKERTSEGLFWQTGFQPGLTLILVWITGSELNTVVACFAVSYLLGMLGSVSRARMSLPKVVGTSAVGWKEMLVLCLPLMLIAVTNSVIELSDTVLLGLIRSAGEVSIYYICAKVTALSTTLLFIINGTIAPGIARRWSRRDYAGAFSIVNKYSKVMLGLAVVILAAMFLLHDYILMVFGEQYREEGAFPLLVLATGYFFVLAAGPLCIFMTMTGHHRQYLHNNMAAAVLNLVLNLFLIPRYGVNGACFATALALSLKNILLYVQFKRIQRKPGGDSPGNQLPIQHEPA